MAARAIISQEMATFLSAISHPQRIAIIETLCNTEKDVNALSKLLTIPHSSVSQHLSILRAHKVVQQRKQGTHVFYRLTQPELANWLMHGLEFLEGGFESEQRIKSAVDEAKKLWMRQQEASDDEGTCSKAPKDNEGV